MTSRALELVNRYNGAILHKSADELAECYDPNATHELPFARADKTLKGREAIRERYRLAWDAAPIEPRAIRNVVVHRTDDDKTVIVEETIALTNRINGASFEVATILVMEIQHGLIMHMRDYTDNLTIATALGRPPDVAR